MLLGFFGQIFKALLAVVDTMIQQHNLTYKVHFCFTDLIFEHIRMIFKASSS